MESLSAFLDDEELFRLTGYVRPAKQIEWLERNNISYFVNARGKIVVRRDMETLHPAPQLGVIR